MLADRRRQGRPMDEWAGGSDPSPNSSRHCQPRHALPSSRRSEEVGRKAQS